MKSLRRKHALVAIAAAVVVTTAASIAIALSCASPAHQVAHLELVSITVDGVTQTDLGAYGGLHYDLYAPYNGSRTAPTGVEFVARTSGDRYYYQETFDDPSMRDR